MRRNSEEEAIEAIIRKTVKGEQCQIDDRAADVTHLLVMLAACRSVTLSAVLEEQRAGKGYGHFR
jgi:phosphoribosyl-ATP pyrophosphohydrolase